MLGSQKGKWPRNHRKTGKNGKEFVLKRLVKQRKHCLPLARNGLKNQENIKRKREMRDVLQNREVLSQNGRVGISAVYFKDNFNHNIHKLHQQHSERLS